MTGTEEEVTKQLNYRSEKSLNGAKTVTITETVRLHCRAGMITWVSGIAGGPDSEGRSI